MSQRQALVLGVVSSLCGSGCFEAIVRVAPDAGPGLTCLNGLTACGELCVDFHRDPAHCGDCTTRCRAAETCAAGLCWPSDCPGTDCADDQLCAAARCIGAACMGVTCSPGLCYRGTCVSGTCGDTRCPPGQICQGSACLDPFCVGVRCAAGRTCVGGVCVSGCINGATCVPAEPCRVGQTSCLNDSSVCADVGAASPGTPCGNDSVCDPSGTCTGCDAGSTCAVSACFTGALGCETGVPVCATTGQLSAGWPCGSGQVCAPDGGCVGCDAGAACDPGNACLTGLTSCASGAAVCVLSAPAVVGTTCGTHQVCDGDGGCVACLTGAACPPPDAPCFDGVLSCGGGVKCRASAARDAGTSCGADRVCAPDAGCIACAAGTPCDAGLCLVGEVACGSGEPRCAVADALPSGTVCGAGQYCNGDGGCGACTPGGACSTGNDCELGTISCSTGSPVCVGQGPKPATVLCRAAVSICDLAETCSGDTLTCPLDLQAPTTTLCGSSLTTACDAQDTCNGAGACLNRVKAAGVLCRAAVAQCDLPESCDGTSPSCPLDLRQPAGASCLGGVCNGTLACNACSQGSLCGTNPSPCYNGVVQCGTGVAVCADNLGSPRLAGVGCPGGVCNGTGACNACAAGSACATNPNVCVNGVITCGTGAPVCTDNPASPRATGTRCGSSTSTACDAQDTCDGAGVCINRVKASGVLCRVAGSSATCNPAEVCNGVLEECPPDTFASAGTPCGSSTSTACDAQDTCDTAGSCVARVKAAGVICRVAGADATCDPPEVCSGTSASCPTNTVASAGTNCGSSNTTGCDAQDTCNSSGACLNRVRGAGVVCRAAATECDLAENCDGTSASCPADVRRLAGTSCTGGVCDGNLACNACSPGTVCGTNPSPCYNGIVQCGTGVAVCADNLSSPRAAGVGCAGGVCNGTGACTPCSAGAACSTNPSACLNGVIACGTGAPVCLDNAASPRLVGTLCGSSTSTGCDAQDTCDGAGGCVNRVKAAGVVCRLAGSDAACNPAEVCNGLSAACPVDTVAVAGTSCGSANSTDCDAQDTCDAAGSCLNRVKAAGVICRAAGSDAACNPAETCTGASATCPGDSVAAAGTNCGSSSSTGCDAQDTCDALGSCVNRVKGIGVVCRAAATECDLAENCDGTTASCPADLRRVAGTSCSGGVCDGNLTCNACSPGAGCGTNPSPCYNGVVQCGTGVAVCADNLSSPRAAGVACPGGVCNGTGACTPCVAGAACTTNPGACVNGIIACGSGAPVCTDNAASPKVVGTLCGSSTSTGCDAQDTCDGAGGCVNRVQSAGVICRPAVDVRCDVAETCTGLSAICPADVLVTNGTVCVAELCDYSGCFTNCAAVPTCSTSLCSNGVCAPSAPTAAPGGCATRVCSRAPLPDGLCCSGACGDAGC